MTPEQLWKLMDWARKETTAQNYAALVCIGRMSSADAQEAGWAVVKARHELFDAFGFVSDNGSPEKPRERTMSDG
jgi:uroporphyrinogen-III synthase